MMTWTLHDMLYVHTFFLRFFSPLLLGLIWFSSFIFFLLGHYFSLQHVLTAFNASWACINHYGLSDNYGCGNLYY